MILVFFCFCYYICFRNLQFLISSDSRCFCIGFVVVVVAAAAAAAAAVVVNLTTRRTPINVNTGLSVTKVGTKKLERWNYECRN